jgi:hypothetical protein
MPLQNRVTPFGTIVAPPPGMAARGDFFGNRGNLHDAVGRVRRPWRSRAWIICLLAFKGRHRTLLQPGRYTELFFLDEATGFAAGHRPCGECRWHDYQRFRACWPALAGQPVQAVDAVLQAERLDRSPRPGAVADLPDGAMVALADGRGPASPDQAFLVWGGRLYPWSHDGYGPSVAAPATARVLTPPALIAVLRQGYRLAIHRSGPQRPPDR